MSRSWGQRGSSGCCSRGCHASRARGWVRGRVGCRTCGALLVFQEAYLELQNPQSPCNPPPVCCVLIWEGSVIAVQCSLSLQHVAVWGFVPFQLLCY